MRGGERGGGGKEEREEGGEEDRWEGKKREGGREEGRQDELGNKMCVSREGKDGGVALCRTVVAIRPPDPSNSTVPEEWAFMSQM